MVLSCEQGAQGGAGVEVALAIGQVLVGEQDLRCVQAVRAEAGFVRLDQTHLAECGGRLLLMKLTRASRPAQALHALGYRSA